MMKKSSPVLNPLKLACLAGLLALPAAALAQPANDACGDAQALTLNVLASGTTNGGVVDGATAPCAFLDIDDQPDVFYSFVAPAAGTYTIEVVATTGDHDATLAAYTDCTQGSVLGCADDGFASETFDVTLAETQLIVIRVGSWLGFSGPFDIIVTGGLPPVTNDECTGATPIVAGTPVTGFLNQYTSSTSVSCSTTVNPFDAWYTFTAPAAGTYSFTGTVSGGTPVLTVFDNDLVNCFGAEIDCDNFDARATLTSGQIVKFRVSRIGAFGNGFSARVDLLVPPSNDTCATATAVPPAGGSFIGDNRIAADDLDVSCDDDLNVGSSRGIWYSIANGEDFLELFVEETSQGGFTTLSLFSGTCAGPLTEISCDTFQVGGTLSPNTTYYVLVSDVDATDPSTGLLQLAFSTTALTGACCAPNLECSVSSRSACLTGGGTFLGVNASCVSGDGNPTDYTGGSALPLAILDNTTASSELTVVAPGTIGALRLSLDITHTFLSDLVITLSNGTVTATIHSGDDFNGDDLAGVYIFSDAAAETIDTAAAASAAATLPPGTYRANSAGNVAVDLGAAFANEPRAGTWTLTIADDAGGDTGTLNNWTLTLEGPGDSPCEPVVPPCPINFDDTGSSTGVIDLADLNAFFDAWGAANGTPCAGPCPLNFDDTGASTGVIDLADLNAFFDAWGAANGTPCP